MLTARADMQATHQGTLRLLHLYLACFLLQEGKFEKAGDYFMRAKADPRLIVRVFPTFRGKVIGSAEEIEVYQGVIKVLSEMPAIEEISKLGHHYSGQPTDS